MVLSPFSCKVKCAQLRVEWRTVVRPGMDVQVAAAPENAHPPSGVPNSKLREEYGDFASLALLVVGVFLDSCILRSLPRMSLSRSCSSRKCAVCF